MRNNTRVPLGPALLFAALALVANLLHGPIHAATRAALLVPDLLVFQPLRPSVLYTLPTVVSDVHYESPHGTLNGREYAPVLGRTLPAIVLALGVYPVGQDDHGLIRLANGLARAGMIVLVPTSEGLNAGHISPVEVDDLIGWFETIQSDPRVDPDRVGFVGFSVGGGLVLAAAADPRIAGSVHDVVTMGGYSDARDLLVSIGSHRSPPDSEEAWSPSELSRAAFYRQLIDLLPNPDERERFDTAYFGQDAAPVDPALLSATGHQVLNILSSEGSADVGNKIDSLPDTWLRSLRKVSISGRTESLKARTFVLHDRSDTYVPVDQSRRLARAAPERFDYVEYDLFSHVVPAAPKDPIAFAGEVLKLGSQLYRWFLTLD